MRVIQRPGRKAGIAAVVIVVIFGLFIAALAGIVFVPTHWPASMQVSDPNPRVKPYYLALGDSLAFGFQPNFNWDQGYAMIWWTELQRHGSRAFYDYACTGETTTQFIKGGCPTSWFRHNYYSKPQLQAAINFINRHKGQVSPVTLDIGADDFTKQIHSDSCSVDKVKLNQKLAKLDRQMTTIILPRLTKALTDKHGRRTGDLILMNYYDPWVRECPNLHQYAVMINTHIKRDAAKFDVPVADAARQFNKHNICKLTWMCSGVHSIHPNTDGYEAIARAFEKIAAY